MSSDGIIRQSQDSTGSEPPSSQGGVMSPLTVMRQWYDSAARALNLGEDTQETAWNLMVLLESKFKTYAGDHTEVRKSWAVRAAVAIFTVIAKEPEWNGVWFTQILRSCETSATSFFAMVEEAKELLALPLQVSEALKQAQEQFNVVVLLFKTFEKAKLEPAKLKSFVWTLYILARAELLEKLDLLANMNLLVALLRMVQVNLARANTAVDASFSHSSSSTDIDVIDILGLRSKVQPDDIANTYTNVLQPWIIKMISSGFLKGTVVLSTGLDDTRIGDGPPFLSPHNLGPNTAQVYSLYQTRMLTSVTALDERFLISNESTAINTPSKFRNFGNRRHAGYVGRRLFTEAELGMELPIAGGTSPPTTVVPSQTVTFSLPLPTVTATVTTTTTPTPLPSHPPTATTVPTPAPFKDLFRSPPPTVLPSQTPVSSSMECVRWLTDNFGGLPEGPSDELVSMFAGCEKNPAAFIQSTVDKLLDRIAGCLDVGTMVTPCASPSTGKSASSNRRIQDKIQLDADETVDHVSSSRGDGGIVEKKDGGEVVIDGEDEAPLKSRSVSFSTTSTGVSESQTMDPVPELERVSSMLDTPVATLPPRPDVKQLSARLYYATLQALCRREIEKQSTFDLPFLHSEVFHKSLFGCVMEIAAYSLNKTSLLFPKMSEIVELSPYDFAKSLEMVRKVYPHLPQALVMHLVHVEDQILEEHAWKSGSSLFESYTGGVQTISIAVGNFLRKVAKLAAGRIEFLVDKLELPERIANEIWTTILHILESNVRLLRDQHLDRVILCTVYGVCKVNQIDKKFTHIIDKYRELRTGGNVFRVIHNIAIRDLTNKLAVADPPIVSGDIIMLYNKFYLPLMKDYLLKFRGNPAPTEADPSVTRPTIALKRLPRSKPASGSGVTTVRAGSLVVTARTGPSNDGHSSVHMTPGTRAMYAFGEPVSQEALAMINKAVNKRQSEPLVQPTADTSMPVTDGTTEENYMGLLIAAAMGELHSQSGPQTTEQQQQQQQPSSTSSSQPGQSDDIDMNPDVDHGDSGKSSPSKKRKKTA